LIYSCCTTRRRDAILAHPELNGIDYLEIKDSSQTSLYVYFLKNDNIDTITTDNILITGGERIAEVKVIKVTSSLTVPPASPPLPQNALEIKVEQPGDFSTYTLSLVKNINDGVKEVLAGFDSVLSKVDFSFKVFCPDEFDCKDTPINCAEEDTAPPPQINYLAKDYASFRQLMLDRMSLLIPEWRERNPSSLGITLVELLAYTADYLSYRQDAISTEAYLGTARKRISVARHARLADYKISNGCNARAWVHLHVGDGVNSYTLKKEFNETKTQFLTKVNQTPTAITIDSDNYKNALIEETLVFELMHDVKLYHEHNQMSFYTYGAESCCLPRGATEATLLGSYPNLNVGDFLILSEIKSPETGQKGDANPKHNQVVRLAKVTPDLTDINIDYDSDSADSPQNLPTVEITKIEWHPEDALQFPLCISHNGENGYVEDVSLALGNIALVDHGRTIKDSNESSLKPHTVPAIRYQYANNNSKNHCEPENKKMIPPRFNPMLKASPLTFSKPVSFKKDAEGNTLAQIDESLSAADLMRSSEQPIPEIYLTESESELTWQPMSDLLIDSQANDRHFVVEMELDGMAHIRFGNDRNGARPNAGMSFSANYRLGNGPEGNVGATSIQHIVADNSVIGNLQSDELKIWNPLPAQGGTQAETIEEVKQYAPQAFRTQERAVTPEDYNYFAQRCNNDIQKATSTFRWTGSWRTVFITADRLGGKKIDHNFENNLRNCLEKYRMTGFDLEIDEPRYVSLQIEMEVCVKPNFFRGTIRNLLAEAFSNQVLPNSKRGFFHPDNFSFGQPLYLSSLYAVAQGVEGVDSVSITKFHRQDDLADNAFNIDKGKLEFARQEIARLDNNPNFRDRGLIHFVMKGGK